MKNRNHKIFLATIALAVNVSFITSPFTAITYAATTVQTQDKNIDVKLDGKNNTNSVSNNFTLTNNGEALDLSKVKLRYYFTSDEGSDGQTFNCYYSSVSDTKGKYKNITEYVHGSFVKLDEPVENADSYLEISFDENAGTFDSSNVLTLNTAINNNNWSKVKTDDDYSFNDSSKTVLLMDDNIISGTSPISNEIRDSEISQNCLTFDSKSVKDTDIIMKTYGNKVNSIVCFPSNSPLYVVPADRDYTISGNILTLKKEFLTYYLEKNTYLTIYFDKGLSQTIFINNDKSKAISDEFRSGINKNEANISLEEHDEHSFGQYYPISFAVTNTSNIDMDLEKLNIKYYYEKENPGVTDGFRLDYCSVLGSNKDIRTLCKSESRPFYNNFYYFKYCCLTESFDKTAGVLKPGETILLRGFFTTKSIDTQRTTVGTPVVTYDGESLYGQPYDQHHVDSKILSDDIILNPKKMTDTSINMQLNNNYLKSIESYSNGTLVKTLKKGTDYILNRRNEVILTESYLNSLSTNTTLEFIFSDGHPATIDIKHFDYGSNCTKGTLTIENTAASEYAGLESNGGYDTSIWTDLTVPVTVRNSSEEHIDSAVLLLKFNKYLFDNVKVSSNNSNVVSADVNYSLGVVKIKLKSDTVSHEDDTPDFNLIFTPSANIKPQKIDLSLDSYSSYYTTSSGELFSPVFKYNNIELLPKK